MAALRGGVAESSGVTSYGDGIADLVRRYAATFVGAVVWTLIAVGCVAVWFGIIYGIAWLAG